MKWLQKNSYGQRQDDYRPLKLHFIPVFVIPAKPFDFAQGREPVERAGI